MEATLLRLLVFLLCLSNLLCLIAVPATRSRSLMHETQVHGVSGSTQLGNDHIEETMEGNAEERIRTVRRMNVEVNDYPGSGANNRHTPYPRPWKGCSDC